MILSKTYQVILPPRYYDQSLVKIENTYYPDAYRNAERRPDDHVLQVMAGVCVSGTGTEKRHQHQPHLTEGLQKDGEGNLHTLLNVKL